MNIDSIFNLFTNNISSNSIVDDYTNTPLFHVETFKYIITNHINTKNRLKYFLKNINIELDENYINEIGERIIFNKAFLSIQNINLHNENHVKVILEQNSSDLGRSLKLCISFFQNLEEYEKCAFLKKIENILKVS
jgi:hypothetical protein